MTVFNKYHAALEQQLNFTTTDRTGVHNTAETTSTQNKTSEMLKLLNLRQ